MMMMKQGIAVASVLVLVSALVLGCGSPTSDPRAERREAQEGQPGDVSPLRAQAWIDDVRLGTQLGAEGVVVEAATCSPVRTRFTSRCA